MTFVSKISQTPGTSASNRDTNRHTTIQNIIQGMGQGELSNITLDFLPADGAFLHLVELLENAPSGQPLDIRTEKRGGIFR